jgi:hypothetical protein
VGTTYESSVVHIMAHRDILGVIANTCTIKRLMDTEMRREGDRKRPALTPMAILRSPPKDQGLRLPFSAVHVNENKVHRCAVAVHAQSDELPNQSSRLNDPALRLWLTSCSFGFTHVDDRPYFSFTISGSYLIILLLGPSRTHV